MINKLARKYLATKTQTTEDFRNWRLPCMTKDMDSSDVEAVMDSSKLDEIR